MTESRYRYVMALPCLLALAGVLGYYAYHGFYLLWPSVVSALTLVVTCAIRIAK